MKEINDLIIETVRVSERGKNQLITLKRKTGIQNWNVLCRWALCLSLGDRSTPPQEKRQTDSSIEMSWKVFGGTHADVYLAIMIQRCKQDGLELSNKTLNEQFRIHLHRGIAFLSTDSKLKEVAHLLQLVMNDE
jgi:DNA sulfur modification protein DndE